MFKLFKIIKLYVITKFNERSYYLSGILRPLYKSLTEENEIVIHLFVQFTINGLTDLFLFLRFVHETLHLT